jgi:hypothetical protein
VHTLDAHFCNALTLVQGLREVGLHLLQGTNGNDLGPLRGWHLTGTNRAGKDPVRDLSSRGP